MYSVDIRNLSAARSVHRGIPIDQNLYDIRDSIYIDALDQFMIIGRTDCIDMDDQSSQSVHMYVVDLARFTNNLRSQSSDIIADTYQFELLYYKKISQICQWLLPMPHVVITMEQYQ